MACGAAFAQHFSQSAAGRVFEDEVGLLLVQFGLERRDDIGVGQAADAARLLQPLCDRIGVTRCARVHELEGDFAIKPRVVSKP